MLNIFFSFSIFHLYTQYFSDEDIVTSRAPLLPKAIAKAPEGEGCPRCGGFVYAAEQMLARGRVSIYPYSYFDGHSLTRILRVYLWKFLPRNQDIYI